MTDTILLSTTDILQGYDINEYCGYIEANRAACILLPDEDAQLEKQLARLRRDAIVQLKEKAAAMHCDALLGASIQTTSFACDTHAIWLTTAGATAVRCQKSFKELPDHVSGTYLRELLITLPRCRKTLSAICAQFRQHDANALSAFHAFCRSLSQHELPPGLEEDFAVCLIAALRLPDDALLFNEDVRALMHHLDADAFSAALLRALNQADPASISPHQRAMLCQQTASIIPLTLLKQALSHDASTALTNAIAAMLKEFRDSYSVRDLVTLREIISLLRGFPDKPLLTHLHALEQALSRCFPDE